MKKYIKKIAKKLKRYFTNEMDSKLDRLLMIEANLQSIANRIGGGGSRLNPNSLSLNEKSQITSINQVEFSAYSQNGEDGIIDFLIEALELDSPLSPYPRAFVEFGVQDYRESNTRYLLKKRNWSGLVIDGAMDNIAFIKNDEISWKHDLEAVCAFITKDNINSLLSQYLESRNLTNIAVLSIDIDGVDYFVWQAISVVNPAIVIVEYNALFGSDKSVSVPYRDDFDRFKAHFSGLYFGASIKALVELGEMKGFCFIGADSSGTNLFFVNKHLLHKVDFLSTHTLDWYCKIHNARQSRDINGRLNFLSADARQDSISHLPLESLD